MTDRLLTDAGPLVTLLDVGDAAHARCAAYAEANDAVLLTTWPVLSEAAWLLRHVHGGVDALLQMWEEDVLEVAALDDGDIPRVR